MTNAYLDNLRKDFESLILAESAGEEPPHTTSIYHGWWRRPSAVVAMRAGAIAAVMVVASLVFFAQRNVATRNVGEPVSPVSPNTFGGMPRGDSQATAGLGLSYAPLGEDPFGVNGVEVSAKDVASIFGGSAPAGTGTLVEPDSAMANSSTLTHVWVGPSGVGDGKVTAKTVVMEYASGIRVRVAPQTDGTPTTLAGLQDAWAADVKEWGSAVATLETVAGVPAEVLHGDGSVIKFPGGDEVVDGTGVSLYLNGMLVNVWAAPTVSQSDVLAAANSLHPTNR